MTVQELIDKLSTFPKDAAVIFTACSEYNLLDEEEVSLYRAEDKIIVLRGGRYVSYNPRHWPADEAPKFVTVAHFPGN